MGGSKKVSPRNQNKPPADNKAQGPQPAPAQPQPQGPTPEYFTISPEGVKEIVQMINEMISSKYVKQTLFTGINTIFQPVFPQKKKATRPRSPRKV